MADPTFPQLQNNGWILIYLLEAIQNLIVNQPNNIAAALTINVPQLLASLPNPQAPIGTGITPISPKVVQVINPG